MSTREMSVEKAVRIGHRDPDDNLTKEVGPDNPLHVVAVPSQLTQEQIELLASIELAGDFGEKRFEWQDVNGEVKPLYIGKSLPGTAESSPTWAVGRWVFDDPVLGEFKPVTVNAAVGIAWTARVAELP